MRETAFKSDFIEHGRKLAALGAADPAIADFFNVSERTLHRWKQAEPAFAEALTLGKASADDRVEQSLYRRATGYSFEAQKVFVVDGKPVVVQHVEHVPADVGAAKFWLGNRRKPAPANPSTERTASHV